MKIRFVRLALAMIIISGFNSCKDEIDVLADWKEIPVVYGLLDVTQPQQVIRINRAYMNPNGNATDIAGIADSLYFDSLYDLKLIEQGTGRQIPLYRSSQFPKDSGLFAYNPNYTYVTPYAVDPADRIKVNYSYKLTFRLPKSGVYSGALTTVVYPAAVSAPVSVGIPPANRIIDINAGKKINIKFQSGKNSKLYDVQMIFAYTDILKSDTNVKVNKQVTWTVIHGLRTIDDAGGEVVAYAPLGENFHQFLVNAIPVDNTVKRRAGFITFRYVGGGQELDNYISASEPSIGIVQKQVDYTNIENGLGILSSRHTLDIGSISLSQTSKKLLQTEPILQPLNFVD